MGFLKDVTSAFRGSSSHQSHKPNDARISHKGHDRGDAHVGDLTAYENNQKRYPSRNLQVASIRHKDLHGPQGLDRHDTEANFSPDGIRGEPLHFEGEDRLPLQGPRFHRDGSRPATPHSTRFEPSSSLLGSNITDTAELMSLSGNVTTHGLEGRVPRSGSETSATMRRIYDNLMRTKKMFPSIQFEWPISPPLSPIDVEMTIRSVVHAYEAVVQELNREIERAEKQCKDLQVKHKSDLDRNNRDFNARSSRFDQDCARLEGRISDYKDRDLKKEEQIRNLQRQHQELQGVIKSANEKHKYELGSLEEEHQRKMAIDRSNASSELAKIKSDLDDQLLQARKSIADTREHYENQIQIMRNVHEDEKRNLRETFETEKTQVTRNLKETVEELKGALVERDHFKAMSDHELARGFQDISSEIDEFARVRWDASHHDSWPFPSKALRNSENERRTKQYLIQNTLWVILYDYIFCSPFRVLGSAGRSLEAEWIEKFGQDLTRGGGAPAHCPVPSKASEKWRYDNMKLCSEAATSPQKDWDYKVQGEFGSSVKKAAEEMLIELERVSPLNTSEMQRMDELVKKAARFWLDVGQQRCRVVLLMSSAGEDPVRSNMAAIDRDGTLSLVVVPELRRKGNSQGERLDTNDLVMDCRGKFTIFHSS